MVIDHCNGTEYAHVVLLSFDVDGFRGAGEGCE